MANQLYKGDKPLATFIPQIADNLTTDDSTKALSAKQGKVLNEKTANDIPYDSNNSVKDMIDEVNAKIQRKEFINKQNLTFDNIPSTCTGLLLLRSFTSSASSFWFLIPVNVYCGSAVIDTPIKTGSYGVDPTGASYSNGTLSITMSASTGSFFATLIYGN